MSRGRVGVFGSGGHARVVADCAIASGLTVEAFYDDDEAVHEQKLMGSPGISIVGGRELAAESGSDNGVLIAIGGNRVRSEIYSWFDERGVEFETVIHPSAVVGSNVEIGAGTVVVAGAVINTGTSIGRHVIVNTSASIDHDCTIRDFVHVSPGAHLAGNVTVGEGAHIATGASVIPGITIGAWSVVGAGAVVMRDVPEDVTLIATPPRVHKRSPGNDQSSGDTTDA